MGRRGLKAKPLGVAQQLFRLIIFLVILVVLIVTLGHAFKNQWIFFPVKGLEATFQGVGWPFEEVWLPRPHGQKVYAWYLPGPPENLTALILHGNAGNLSDMIGRIMTYHRLRMGVMAIDYPGYGLSEGEPSLASAVESAVLAWDYLVNARRLEPRKILVHGFSLGGGVAGQLVARRPSPHPLVMDATFTSLAAVAEMSMPILGPLPKVILGESYDTQAALRDYKATFALFLHSPQDEVIPYALGRALYDSYQNGPKALVNLTGRHNDYISDQSIYERALIDGLGLVFPQVPQLDPPLVAE
ncbi:MAG: alpha/beta hydrolase [Deltaproteobacteria bacterium]|nr:alpha/beta hydrolase [Deltaproteobacteria bacterium]